MARTTGKDHAQINLDIWGDDDWLDLTPPAQHLYFVLWTSPQLSYCGTGEWHPGRISSKANGWTPHAVETAAAELSGELFLVIDTDTEEFILRSWMKHDGIWKKPNMAVSMANARAALASRILRGVVVHEVAKIKARNIADAAKPDGDPVSSSWQRNAVANLLSQKAIDPAELEPFTPTLTPPPTPGLTPRSTLPPTVGAGVGVNPRRDPGPTPTPAPSPTSNSNGGYVGRERHLASVPDSNAPPNPRCAEHVSEPSTKACGGCADARRYRNDWDIAQVAVRVQAIHDCPDCDDETGFVEVSENTWKRCDHPKLQEAAHA